MMNGIGFVRKKGCSLSVNKSTQLSLVSAKPPKTKGKSNTWRKLMDSRELIRSRGGAETAAMVW